MLKTIFFLLTLFLIAKGLITPDANAITSNYANKVEFTDYTFAFKMSSDLPAGSKVQIIFPRIYQSGLGIPLKAVCSSTCVRSDKTVTFNIDNLIAKDTKI